MPNDHGPRQGYLLLADIAGYTKFLTGTELEHAHAVIRELTKLIRERLAPPMRFVNDRSDETREEYRRVLLPISRAHAQTTFADLLAVMQEAAAAVHSRGSGESVPTVKVELRCA